MEKFRILKKMGPLIAAVFAILLSAIMTCCDKGSDGMRRGDNPELPSERPDPAGGKWNFEAEFRDSSPRFEGGDISLRYDRTGVLVKHRPDGSGAFIDLGGGRRIDFSVGGLQRDSICGGAWITIDGQRLTGTCVRLKKQTAEAAWYHVEVQKPTGGYMLVIPR